MDLDPVILSRIQFAVPHQLPHHLPGFHYRVGGVAGDHRGAGLVTGNPLYRRVFSISGVRCVCGLVRHGVGGTGVAGMEFQFGTNWAN